MTNVELEAKVKLILDSGNMEAIQLLHDQVIDIGERRYRLQAEVVLMHERYEALGKCSRSLRCLACRMLNKSGLGSVIND